ncbi:MULTISPECIES: hypothetical protein [unclassified Sphingobacterium]|uniref:hypothetical protein n=1 Tax=unclassified Sphingobacterium TaxID=2609468 RepID=UPI0025D955DF|nr:MULTISPECIES: hypothetical protein [unclassified Sphingobacterium]
MIIEGQIINRPYSGEYEERIYDNNSPWNSQGWTYIKFTNDDCSEWCGVFRGFPKAVSISSIKNIILVLTSDYLYQLSINGDQVDLEEQSQYQNLTATPFGDFILADYSYVIKIINSIQHQEKISSPIEMDNIRFKTWNGPILEFTCDEFCNWNRHLNMIYNSETNKIEIKNEST